MDKSGTVTGVSKFDQLRDKINKFGTKVSNNATDTVTDKIIKRNKKKVIIGSVVILVVFIGLLIVFYYFGKSNAPPPTIVYKTDTKEVKCTPDNKSTNQPTNQPTDQPTGQPTDQPNNQPNNMQNNTSCSNGVVDGAMSNRTCRTVTYEDEEVDWTLPVTILKLATLNGLRASLGQGTNESSNLKLCFNRRGTILRNPIYNSGTVAQYMTIILNLGRVYNIKRVRIFNNQITDFNPFTVTLMGTNELNYSKDINQENDRNYYDFLIQQRNSSIQIGELVQPGSCMQFSNIRIMTVMDNINDDEEEYDFVSSYSLV